MKIQFNPSALSETKWYEYTVRFAFGGIITAIAGTIAKEYGPVIGGLFLAFPAIFPASVTLVQKHEREEKDHHGEHGAVRGKGAAGVDAAGAALGSIGLLGFGAVVWFMAANYPAWSVL